MTTQVGLLKSLKILWCLVTRRCYRTVEFTNRVESVVRVSNLQKKIASLFKESTWNPPRTTEDQEDVNVICVSKTAVRDLSGNLLFYEETPTEIIEHIKGLKKPWER